MSLASSGRIPLRDLAEVVRTGKRMLDSTDPLFAPAHGAELLAEAAQTGDAEAAALVAVLAGAGSCRPQNWEAALDHLQLAAERGWAAAQQQLRLLARAGGDYEARPASESGAWKSLRDAIDVDRWITPPAKQPLCESPRIRRIENFLPQAVCDWLIERARPKLKAAKVYASEDASGTWHHARSNREADFNIMETDLPLLLVRARIAAATGLPPAVMELTKVLHYAVGQQFLPHFDFLDPEVPAFASELALRGQRLITCLIYLNDDFAGGETEFPLIGLRHRGGKGDALLFANVDRAGRPDRQSLHAGLPPTRGEKWLLSQWIRDRAPRVS